MLLRNPMAAWFLIGLIGASAVAHGQQSTPEIDASHTVSTQTESTTQNESERDDQGDNQSNTEGDSIPFESQGFLGKFFNTPPLSYMITGGLFMWPILLMGIIGLGVIIERYRSLKMLDSDTTEVRQTVQTMLDDNQVLEAFDYCNAQDGPVPAILATGLRKYMVLKALDYDAAKTEEQVVKSMDDYSVHVVAALERHLPILATIASAAPMVGFLGTVQGMIVAFDDIVRKMGETNIVEAAASGIMVSLMTTCFGLIIGIPAFVAFNYFTSVINRFVLDVEESATELIETVTLQVAVDRAEEASR